MTNRSLSAVTAAILLFGLISADAQSRVTASPEKAVSSPVKTTATPAPGELPARTREPWRKTKGYASEDPAVYREAVTQRLKELAAEIARMKEQSEGLIDRGYYIMRLNALEQHEKYAERQLAELPQGEIAKGKDSPRTRLDTIIERLEAHLDLTREEGKDFVLVEQQSGKK